MKRNVIFALLPLLLLSSCGTKAPDNLWNGGANFYEDPRGYNSIESGSWKCKYLRLGQEEEIIGRPDCVYPNPFESYLLYVQEDLTNCTWIMGEMDHENNTIYTKNRWDSTCRSEKSPAGRDGDHMTFSKYYADGLTYMGGDFVYGYLKIRAYKDIDVHTGHGTLFYNLYFCHE